MKPYKIAEENDQFVTYQFRTVYIYILYVVFALMLIGVLAHNTWLSVMGVSLMVAYFFRVSIPYMPVYLKIRKALREDSVEFSGSKWSFAKPLRMKLKKRTPTTEMNATSG